MTILPKKFDLCGYFSESLFYHENDEKFGLKKIGKKMMFLFVKQQLETTRDTIPSGGIPK